MPVFARFAQTGERCFDRRHVVAAGCQATATRRGEARHGEDEGQHAAVGGHRRDGRHHVPAEDAGDAPDVRGPAQHHPGGTRRPGACEKRSFLVTMRCTSHFFFRSHISLFSAPRL